MYHKRRKKATHKRTHRRSSRRVSGIKDVDFTQIALLIGGAVVGRIISTKLAASTNTTMQKLAPYVSVGAGIVIPMVVTNPMLKVISLGMVAGGGVTLLGPTGLKVISGIENTIAYPYNAIPYQKRIAGTTVDGRFVSKPNWSGSRQSQANVISGVKPEVMNACGMMN